MAARLTTWYAATAVLLVLAAGYLQYRRLVRDLAAEDDQLLRETLAVVQHGVPVALWSGQPAAPGGPYVRELDETCRVVGGAQITDGPPPRCPAVSGAVGMFRTWGSPGGDPWRILTAGRSGTPGRWVEVVLNRSTDQAVLSGYRHQVAVLLPLLVLTSTLLGYLVARRGLEPIRRLAIQVGEVNARSLGQRLGGLPAPQEIEALTNSFDIMLARLQAAFDALTQFSAELAHEFRTPLHILRQQAEVALRQAHPDEYRDILASSLEEIDRLRALVDDTLFLARAEDPRHAIVRQAVPVEAELRVVAEYLEALATERGVSLVVAEIPDLVVHAEPMLLRRALVNLVTNAIRHTPAQGTVTMRAFPHSGGARLEVCDTGEGIPAGTLPRMFDRYHRAPRAPTSDGQAGGVGLGLAIVRGIMQLHGGVARAVNQPEGGACLSLHFPRDPLS